MRPFTLMAFVLAPAVALASGAKKPAGPTGPDWKDQVIRATGQGAPDLRAPSPAAARLGAERAAELDALRNALAQVKGIALASGTTVGDRMAADAEIAAKVQGVIRSFKIVDKRYFSDGGVEIDVEVPMSGVLGQLVEPRPEGKKLAALPAHGAPANTGLVIDAHAFKVQPALEPRVLDESGNPLYGAEVVEPDWVKKQGVAGYLKSLDEAKKNARVGEKPLVVKAVKAQGSDVFISNADAAKLRDPQGNVQYLAEGRVIIVAD